ncbi:MAG: DUF420 domain-containing protein [Armatimonadetes bacterium]|nr:DUF420 domain-containing protein [Armatimonadota bacterium]MBI2246456.1 DUF420 domain-containing protein [Armatimonadota bacterium]MBI2972759.1 DUF420 domain-containing protein [Armatimonadota bacterium]
MWWWTAGISLAVYGVLGYALSSEPPVAVPQILALLVAAAPHLIAAINTTALLCLLLGYRAIRAGRIAAHRRFMLAAALLISAFLVLYVTRVALGGVKAFEGPPFVRTYIYLPTLSIHITLSILSVPLIVHNVLVGLSFSAGEVATTAHPRVGRLAVYLWSSSLALGVVVYVLLNHAY